jgi:hypothetical protein
MIIGTNHIVLACLYSPKDARKPHAKMRKSRVKTEEERRRKDTVG